MKIKDILKFAVYVLVMVFVMATAMYLIEAAIAEFKTAALIVAIELLATLLSIGVSYIYLSIPFLKALNEGDDKEMNSVERHTVLNVIAKIFMSVHILVGLVVLGVYIAVQ